MPRSADSRRKVLARGFLLFGVATASSQGNAQDALVADLFPGVELSKHLLGAGTDLYVAAHAAIESDGREYVAVTYYQPYAANVRNRYANYAVLERVGRQYEVRLDTLAADDAAGSSFEQPFLYRVAGAELVVFSTCSRGCRYTIFRLGPAPREIPLERYVELGVDESFSGRGDIYRFDEAGLSATFKVARRGDASCCPSGGTLDVSYRLQNDRFEISGVQRSNRLQ